jgi:YggT family protein
MLLLANLLSALAKIVELANGLLTVYKYLVVASVILSWVHADPYNPIVTFIYRLTEPLLRPIRRRMPDTGMIDFSPLVAFALIFFIQIVVFDSAIYYLIQYSSQLKLRG